MNTIGSGTITVFAGMQTVGEIEIIGIDTGEGYSRSGQVIKIQ